MRILLLQPNYDAHVIHPPLGLGYLAAYLIKNLQEVNIFDATLKNASLDQILSVVGGFNPDLVGITVLSRGHNKAREAVQAIKNQFRSLPVVIGGTQVTALPMEVMEDLRADFGVIGEGEITLLELINSIEDKKDFSRIKGLAYFSNERLKINKKRDLIKNLDKIPFPAWHLMPPSEYRIVPILEPAKAFPVAPIITSRGCPYDCSFCASNATWGRRIRFRSPENVLQEIMMLKDKFEIKEIHFADDNFTFDTKRAEKICDLMIREKIDLPWQCPNGVRIDRLPLPLLRKMKKSGCYAVGLGIESGNQKILEINRKSLNLRIVPEVLKNLKEVGIESNGFFILGLPGDTRQTINETINFALENSFDRAWFNLFTPYPGSPAFSDWRGEKKISKIDWDKHDCSTAVIELTDVSGKDLEKWQKIALAKFYLKPKNFVNFVSRLRPREILTFMMSRFFSKIGRPGFLLIHKLMRR